MRAKKPSSFTRLLESSKTAAKVDVVKLASFIIAGVGFVRLAVVVVRGRRGRRGGRRSLCQHSAMEAFTNSGLMSAELKDISFFSSFFFFLNRGRDLGTAWADLSEVGERRASERKPGEEAGSLFFFFSKLRNATL